MTDKWAQTPIAHLCCGKTIRPYPTMLCSCCRAPEEGVDMSISEVTKSAQVVALLEVHNGALANALRAAVEEKRKAT